MSNQDTILKIDSILNDKYIVEKYLGGGAFGEVYRVKHRYLKIRRAIKVFKNAPEIKGNFDSIDKLLEEAQLLLKFDHKNIVKVHDAGILTAENGDKYVFFEMDFFSKDLDEYWKSFGARFMPVDIVIDVIKQICLGLNVLHSEKPPMIHRDIKPQNIMVDFDNDGRPIAKLTDFGLVKTVNPSTLYASAKGTLAFKAPEFLEKKDDTSTDIFAVGVTFYMLLTDKLPYPIDSEFDVMTGSWLKTKPKPISEYNPLVRDQKLEDIVFTAISTDPENRYRDAHELLEAITNWENSRDGDASITDSAISHSVKSNPSSGMGTADSKNDEEFDRDVVSDSGSVGTVSIGSNKSGDSGRDEVSDSGSVGTVSIGSNKSDESSDSGSVGSVYVGPDKSAGSAHGIVGSSDSLSPEAAFESDIFEDLFGDADEISPEPPVAPETKVDATPDKDPEELIKDALWAVSHSMDYEHGVDYLKQAFSLDPELKSIYGSKLELWECFVLIQNPNTIDEGIFNLKKLADENSMVRNDYAFTFDLLSKKDAQLLEKEAVFSNVYNKPKEASAYLELAMLMDVNIKNRYKNKLKILKNGSTF